MISHSQINSESAVTTQACRDSRLARLPIIRVGHDNDVGLELVAVGLKEVSKRGRADFFFAFDVDNNVRAQILTKKAQRPEVNNDARAIVRSSASIDAITLNNGCPRV